MATNVKEAHDAQLGRDRDARVWVLAAGRGGEFWGDWLDRSIAAVGWDEIGDLSAYSSQEEIERTMREEYDRESDPSNDSLACWEFLSVMQPGDLVFVKAGRKTIIGVGEILSGYRYEESAPDHLRHVRDANWYRSKRWTTNPRTRPRPSWDKEKKLSGDWRSEPRLLPTKTLTDIAEYSSMRAELEILVGLSDRSRQITYDGQIDSDKLAALAGNVIQPWIEKGLFEKSEWEGYVEGDVLPAAQRNLLPEVLSERPTDAVKQALKSHANLLHNIELSQAKDFADDVNSDELRDEMERLLRGDERLQSRVGDFLDWAEPKKVEEGREVGINGTVASYLLAMSSPAEYAFCKPSMYKEAAQELLGPGEAVSASDEAKRIWHASQFYGDVLRRLRRDHDIPFTNLLPVHITFYRMWSGSDTNHDWGTLMQEEETTRHWWLNCSPDHWDPRDAEVGERKRYTARNDNGNKRRIYRNFEEVEPGDRLIGYVTTPVREVAAEFEVTRGMDLEEDFEEIEFEKVEAIDDGPTRSDLVSDPGLEQAEPFRTGGQGSLFRLEDEEYRRIRKMLGDQAPSYSVDQATEGLFYPEETFRKWLNTLSENKNVILQGPPGVGKTFVVKRLAYVLIGREATSQVRMVQFHQSYAYEDFIRGYRPTSEGGFELQDGVFHKFCAQARQDSEEPYVFIIDEINRGNLSKIFGELMMLIESDKRGPDYSVPLAYQKEKEVEFYVPENVYLIGMMNTADRSLAMVDYALRRRFSFIDMGPRFEDPTFEAVLRSRGADGDLVGRIRDRVGELNDQISDDDVNLGPGFQVGHSYFCPTDGQQATEEWYERVVNQEIQPLLMEYWFDNREKAKEEVRKLLD